MLKELRKGLKVVVSLEEEELDQPGTLFLEKDSRRVKWNKRRIGKEFRINAQVGRLRIRDTMLDMGLDVNIL